MSYADKARKVMEEITRYTRDFESELSELRPSPFLDASGDMVIPFNCDSRYHWWNGGQSIKKTIKKYKH